MRHLPSDNLGVLVVRPEKVMVAVCLGGLSSVLAHIENAGFDANPVHVTGQLFRNVRLATGRQAHHGNHMWNVHIGRGAVT